MSEGAPVDSTYQRASEIEREGLLDHLRLVGPQKPLGYLPLTTISEMCETDVGLLVEELESRGIKTLRQSQEESGIYGGALYAYDEEALTSLLHSSEQTLLDAHWPTEPGAFVRHLNITAPQKTELFNVIADAFNDKQNPGRLEKAIAN